MKTPRIVEAEWLDELAADDPRALRSRADLRVVNAWMGQAGIMAGALLRHWGRVAPAKLIDLGAGDGTFTLRVAQRLAPHWRNVTAILLDRQNLVTEVTLRGFSALHWRAEGVAADVFDFLSRKSSDADVVTANLFLHHFRQDRLAELLVEISRSAPLLVACEPRRDRFALWGSRVVWVIGCSAVTRHDAVASVRAGFRANELSALWPGRRDWDLDEYRAWPFAHCFAARRRNGKTP
jgi:hypothetical protein